MASGYMKRIREELQRLRLSRGNKRRMLMNSERLLIVKILNLASGIDPDVLNCLLLIKYISTTSDETLRWSKAITCDNGEILWDMIVREACKTDGSIFSVIKYALDRIKSNLLFAANMDERLCAVAVDEYVLRDIIHLLSNISADNNTLSVIFEYYLARKMRTSSFNFGDFYTPKQVVQLMVELLGIEHDGKVYDPCCGSGAMLCFLILTKNCCCMGKHLIRKHFLFAK